MRTLLAIMLVTLMLPSAAWAQYSPRTVSTLPMRVQIEEPRAVVPPDLNGVITQLNSQGMGYQKFRIDFSDAMNVGVLEDKEIDFTFTITTVVRKAPTCTVRVTIPKGEVSNFSEVLVPVPENSYQIEFETQVNGTRVEALCTSAPVSVQSYTQFSTVLIGDEADFDSISKSSGVYIVSHSDQTMWNSVLEVRNSNSQITTTRAGLPPTHINANRGERQDLRFALLDNIPIDPIEWSTTDNIFLSSKLLGRLNESQTECLKQYTRSSGLLIVYGNLSADDLTAQCSKWLNPGIPSDARGWKDTTFDYNTYKATSFGMGHVAVLPFMPTNVLMSEPHLRNHIASSQYATHVNNVTKSLRDQSFWNWHLTRLGQPPVGAFAILIGLFAGLVAPALLIYCLRSNRTVWLLVIFPLIAVIGTLALISFAVVHDGFGTHTRVRSLTMLDVNSDQGVCITRQVMFSGMTPKERIEFDRSTEVWPLDQSDPRPSEGGGRIGWVDDKQVFDRLVRPREQFQFATRQSVRQLKPFEWVRYPAPMADDQSTMECEIKNLLDESISLAIVSDGEGLCFQAQNVGPKATSVLQQVDPSSAALALARQEETQPLEPPLGLRSGRPSGLIESFFGYRRRYSFNPGGSSHDIMAGLNRQLMKREYLMKHQCFFVYPEQGRYIDRALQTSDEQDSLHMIFGLWEKTE